MDEKRSINDIEANWNGDNDNADDSFNVFHKHIEHTGTDKKLVVFLGSDNLHSIYLLFVHKLKISFNSLFSNHLWTSLSFLEILQKLQATAKLSTIVPSSESI